MPWLERRKHPFLACLSAVQLHHTFTFLPQQIFVYLPFTTKAVHTWTQEDRSLTAKQYRKHQEKILLFLTSPQVLGFNAAKKAKFYCYSIAHIRELFPTNWPTVFQSFWEKIPVSFPLPKIPSYISLFLSSVILMLFPFTSSPVLVDGGKKKSNNVSFILLLHTFKYYSFKSTQSKDVEDFAHKYIF